MLLSLLLKFVKIGLLFNVVYFAISYYCFYVGAKPLCCMRIGFVLNYIIYKSTVKWQLGLLELYDYSDIVVLKGKE